MNAKVWVLLAAILAFALTGVQQVQAAERTEKAEKRAERAEERAEKRADKAEEREERAEEKAEKRAKKRAERAREKDRGTESSSRGPEEVTLDIRGGSGVEFSGTCTVGDEEYTLSGEVPQTFDYSLDGQKLECEIQNAGSGSLKIILTGNGTRAVQQIGSGGTVSLTYDGNGISSSVSSSGSTSVVSSSSSVSSG